MSRTIAVIGTGYVGLITAVGLADFGNRVVGVDTNAEIVASLANGVPTIYELGVADYLERNVRAGRLSFTTESEKAIRESDVIFIAVGTPGNPDGSADLSQVDSAVQSISRVASSPKIVVVKSTVPVGTNRLIAEQLAKSTISDGKTARFTVVSNPEFLREGRAVQDFFHPDRIVIGTDDMNAREIMREVYRPLYLISTPFVWCDWETAELSKYASNAFLATKITFINQMANLTDACGADIHVIARIMGMDGRISGKFLHPGPGFGGSCFPKDTRALAEAGTRLGVDMTIVREVIKANEDQKRLVVQKLKHLLAELTGRRIAVLGLAFKAETDDVRESPAIDIVPRLLEEQAYVAVHDPKALPNFRRAISINAANSAGIARLRYAESEFDALRNADAVLILTEWNEYRNMDLRRTLDLMRGRIVFDARNVLDKDLATELGFVYHGMGR